MRKYLLVFLLALTIISRVAGAENNDQTPVITEAQKVEGKKIARLNTMRMRAAYQRQLNDLVMAFQEYIPHSSICYQTAFSNYVEDQWNRIAKETGCDSDDVVCGQTTASSNPGESQMDIDKKTELRFHNMWFIAAHFYKFLKPMEKYLIPNDEIESFSNPSPRPAKVEDISQEELARRIKDLNKYVASCDASQPVAWSVVGKPIQTPPDLTVTAIKLGISSTLVDFVLGYHLPDDKKGYVGCLKMLHPLTSDTSDPCKDDEKCIETIPADTKETLLSQLEELKAHQCSPVYANEMAHRK